MFRAKPSMRAFVVQLLVDFFSLAAHIKKTQAMVKLRSPAKKVTGLFEAS